MDARVGAWVSALQITEAVAEQYARHPDTPGSWIEHHLDRARVLADLARAPESVGILAGSYLEQEQERRQQSRERIEEVLRGR